MQMTRFIGLVTAGFFLASVAHADPTIVGAAHASFTLTPGVTTTIVSAAANTNGVSLKTAVLQVNAGVGGASLQTSDGTPIFGIFSATTNLAIGNLPYPMYLPPGVGLIAVTSEAGEAFVTYDNP